MKTLSVAGYREVVECGIEHLLLDVRQPEEWDICHLDHATLIPLASLPASLAELAEYQNRPVYCICHHGGRSQQAAMFLQSQGFTDLTNVAGGMHAWALQIDPSLPTY